MSFEKDGYVVIKNTISKEVADLSFQYLQLKAEVYDVLLYTGYVNEFNRDFGWFDKQVPSAYSIYADTLMETLLSKVKPVMEKETKLNLVETYSYARLYKKGDELKKHTDRISCKFSTTLNLGGDLWPIFVADNKVELYPGDMLVYKGNELEHWREKFEGDICGQVFLHYNDLADKDCKKFDNRWKLGLPDWYKDKDIQVVE